MAMNVDHDPRFELTFAERMWLAWSRSGLSAQDLAARLEVSRNTVSSWTNGRNRPRPRDLKAFALATGYPLRWLETGEVTHDGPDGSPVTHRYRRLASVTALEAVAA